MAYTWDAKIYIFAGSGSPQSRQANVYMDSIRHKCIPLFSLISYYLYCCPVKGPSMFDVAVEGLSKSEDTYGYLEANCGE